MEWQLPPLYIAEFESATAWFDVLPLKNKSTNRVVCSSLQIIIMQPVSGINMQGVSNHKYEFCGKTDQSSSPVQ